VRPLPPMATVLGDTAGDFEVSIFT
jgi:hypothetical protein